MRRQAEALTAHYSYSITICNTSFKHTHTHTHAALTGAPNHMLAWALEALHLGPERHLEAVFVYT